MAANQYVYHMQGVSKTYPGGKHGLSPPWMKTHVYRTIAAFFDRHLKDE